MNDQFTNNPFENNEVNNPKVENALIPLNGNTGKQKKNKKRTGFSKKGTLLVTGVVALSGLFGFGGGLLANGVSGANKSIMLESVERTSSTSNETSNNGTMTTQQIAESAGNSVVEIKTETVTNNNRLQQAVSEGAGSGVVMTADGYVVTNNHVIDGANKITVTLKSGESHQATLIGTDSSSDVALLKIEASNLQPAVMGDSSKLSVGEAVVAIGNPLGELGGTVTDGIISALNREITIDGDTMNLLQTNAAINPGNSGGGLFNQHGELIGIVDAKSTGTGVEGLGFAIPINDAKNVVESLSQNGYVKGRPSLGVALIDVDSAETAMRYRVSETGVYVAQVTENSGAASAGFQSGDKIISVDGTEVASSTDVKTAIKKHQVGDKIEIEVKRMGGTQKLTATLGEEVPTTSK